MRIGTRFGNILIALILTPFIIHHLGVSHYGLWALVGAFLGYYGLMDLGMGMSLARFISAALANEDYEECNKFTSTGFTVYSVSGSIVVLITVILAAGAYLLDLPQGKGALFGHLILIMGLTQGIGLPLQVYGSVLSANLRFDLLSTFYFFILMVRTALIVVFLKGGFGILGLAYASATTSLLSHFITYIAVRRILPQVKIQRGLVTWATARTMFSYSAFVTVATVANLVRFKVDVVVIAAFLSLTATAYYQIAAMFGTHLRMGMTAIFGVLFPYFSRLAASDQHVKLQRAMFFTTRRAVQLSMLVGFTMVAWGRDFIEWWLEPEFLAAYPSLVVLVVGMTFACTQMPCFHFLYGISKNRFFAFAQVVEAAINLGLTLLLVKPLGILGVAIGTTVPMILIQSVVLPIYACRHLEVRVSTYFLFMGRVVLTSLVGLAIPAFIAVRFSQPSLVVIASGVFVSWVIYTLVVWAIETLSFERNQRRNLFRWFLAVPKQI